LSNHPDPAVGRHSSVRLLATIEDPELIGKILRHLDLPVNPPEPTPARSLDWLPGFAIGTE
jgi:hypothetical protein